MLPELVRWRGYPAFLIKLSSAILVSSTLAVAPAGADTLHVPAQYATIQAAIVAAADGDTILVAAGTYRESLEWSHKDLLLLGAGADTTVIDATGMNASCLHMVQVPATARVEGFTFTGGTGTRSGNYTYGGGVFLDDSRGTIARNVISGNTAERGGGLATLDKFYGRPTITGNVVTGNSATRWGGGVFVGSQARLLNNIITENTADQLGGGVYATGTLLVGNVIARNSALQSAAGLCFLMGGSAINNTITANTGGVGGGAVVAIGGVEPRVGPGGPGDRRAQHRRQRRVNYESGRGQFMR